MSTSLLYSSVCNANLTMTDMPCFIHAYAHTVFVCTCVCRDGVCVCVSVFVLSVCSTEANNSGQDLPIILSDSDSVLYVISLHFNSLHFTSYHTYKCGDFLAPDVHFANDMDTITLMTITHSLIEGNFNLIIVNFNAFFL